MLLGGLWHGANWTFVFWGGLNGLALCFDKMLKHKKSKNIIKISFNIFVTYCFITITWIFFRAENFMIAWKVIKGIFTLQNGVIHNFFWSYLSIIIIVIATFCAIKKSRKIKSDEINGYYPIVNLNSILGLTIFLVACGLLLILAFTGESPFVYFQF